MKRVRQWLAAIFGFSSVRKPLRIRHDAPAGLLPAAAEHTLAPPIGTVLGNRYRLDQLIGRGGAAAVYRGYDLELDHLIAVKVMLLNASGGTDKDPAFERHLRSEAFTAMRLSHPLIARVYTYERQHPWEYLIMEFVPGKNLQTLTQMRENGRLKIKEVIHVGLDVLEALDYAHSQGILHNDITPKNILIDKHNTVKVCDFGLSRLTDLHFSRSGRLSTGTVAYLSPERINQLPVDVRSDLYSLGATLYAVACGRPPFGYRARDALNGHSNYRPPPCDYLPSAFETIVNKALEKDPDARFANARDMAVALAGLLRGRRYDDSIMINTEPLRQPLQAMVAPTIPQQMSEPRHLSNIRTLKSPTSEMAWITARKIRVENHKYEISGFYMDYAPVTNVEYAEFVQETQQRPPAWWSGKKPPTDQLDHPVVGITIAQARRYAAWRKKRLPTTLEWIAVAQGEEGRLFPWGDALDRDSCHCPRENPQRTAPVKSFPQGATPEGCTDLLGNVWEWTEADSRFTPPEPGYQYVMGGSYRHPCKADEGILPRTTVGERGEYLYLGFRCASDGAAP